MDSVRLSHASGVTHPSLLGCANTDVDVEAARSHPADTLQPARLPGPVVDSAIPDTVLNIASPPRPARVARAWQRRAMFWAPVALLSAGCMGAGLAMLCIGFQRSNRAEQNYFRQFCTAYPFSHPGSLQDCMTYWGGQVQAMDWTGTQKICDGENPDVCATFNAAGYNNDDALKTAGGAMFGVSFGPTLLLLPMAAICRIGW